jgi:thiaminase/transcriptional activator TenA
MSFSTHLREQADPIFRAIRMHPFVQGIAHQTISREALIHYVRQDVQYLQTYARVYGIALAKAETPEQMRMFYERIGVVLGGELIPHLNLCRAASVDYEALKRTSGLAPTAHHYAQHMQSTAQSGSLGEIVAVLLPCHWTYVDLATHIVAEIQPSEAHTFYDWLTFYASEEMKASLEELIALLDDCADRASEAERARMASAFLASCRLEYAFFDMAYKLETWPDETQTIQQQR